MKDSVSSIATARPSSSQGLFVASKGRFQSSIETTLAIAGREAGAEGYALYECETNSTVLSLRCAHGAESHRLAAAVGATRNAEHAPDGEGVQGVVSLPLRGAAGLVGLLDFWFRNVEAVTPEQRNVMDRGAETVALLLAQAKSLPTLVNLVARVAELENQLADLKVSERAAGLREADGLDRKIESLHDHVSSVLGGSPVYEYLTAQVKQLEERVEERRVIGGAKAVLQRTFQLTEEEAYLHLRNTSRRSRRRIFVVATEVLTQDGELVGRRSLTA